eukprot:6154508-Pyramimonas_sp.AAC.1
MDRTVSVRLATDRTVSVRLSMDRTVSVRLSMDRSVGYFTRKSSGFTGHGVCIPADGAVGERSSRRVNSQGKGVSSPDTGCNFPQAERSEALDRTDSLARTEALAHQVAALEGMLVVAHRQVAAAAAEAEVRGSPSPRGYLLPLTTSCVGGSACGGNGKGARNTPDDAMGST